MALDLLNRLEWNINDRYLRDITIDGHRLSKEERELLGSPIYLETPRLILNLRPSKCDAPLPVEFETEKQVTPLVILGAISSYYASRVDGMENLLMGFQQEGDGSLTPKMEIEFHIELPHVPMVKPAHLPVILATTNNPQQQFGLTMQPYTAKSIVVRGDAGYATEIGNAMEKLGGLYNPSLRGGPGWIFAKSKEKYVENYFKTGQYYPLNNFKPLA